VKIVDRQIAYQTDDDDDDDDDIYRYTISTDTNDSCGRGAVSASYG